MMEWGEPGAGPGQFNLLHAIVIDADRRVYIADRRNSRIQVFTENGEFVEAWPDIFDPVDMFITEDQSIWVMDGSVQRLLKYDRTGQLQYHWGTYSAWRVGAAGRGGWPGAMLLPHQIAVDGEGALYVANYNAGQVDKFVPKPNADPAKLVGQPLNLVRGPVASRPVATRLQREGGRQVYA